MEWRIQKKTNENVHNYPTADMQVAHKFATSLKRELHDFLLGVVLFGSSARHQSSARSDIDVLVVTDDTKFRITEPMVEGYRVIVESVAGKVSPKLHITSMTFTSFWEYIKAGDPVAVNILRDGVPMLEEQFFTPLQVLLKQGRVRPSQESVYRYFGRAPKTLLNSKWHLLQATLDLYWAVIDAGHAALMMRHEVPPTPDHVADSLEKVYVKPGLLSKRYAQIMRDFYNLSKKITHREIQEVSGAQYEKYYKDADDFVRTMKKLIERGKF